MAFGGGLSSLQVPRDSLENKTSIPVVPLHLVLYKFDEPHAPTNSEDKHNLANKLRYLEDEKLAKLY